MEQKVIFVEGQKYPDLTNLEKELNSGFLVKSVHPQHLTGKGDSIYVEYGGWLCILERGIQLS